MNASNFISTATTWNAVNHETSFTKKEGERIRSFDK